MGAIYKSLQNIIDNIITKRVLKLKIQIIKFYRGPNCGTHKKMISS